MGDSPKYSMKAVILALAVSFVSAAKPQEREGGLFGFGLLDFGGEATATTTAAPSDPLALLTSILTEAAGETQTTTDSTATGPDLIGRVIDVLTGVTTCLPFEDIASLLGIETSPVPSPSSDPIGFLLHPLILPIILAAITVNPAALALAMGALAGNLMLTHLLTQQAAEGC